MTPIFNIVTCHCPCLFPIFLLTGRPTIPIDQSLQPTTTANNRNRHPPLFVSPSIASSPFTPPCSDAPSSAMRNRLKDKRLLNMHKISEAVGLVDFTAHATSLSLLGLTNLSFSLKKLRVMPLNEDLILRSVSVKISNIHRSNEYLRVS